ncbi:MAG: hydrogenase maturation protease [Acidobacteria bacterium]|nr:hydrogenase maturation protease [Acidobacteriota bacterium]
MSNQESAGILILGIGNMLMGDEGVGVHVIEKLSGVELPRGVECLDGGTGSFLLLDPMQRARKVILIDATVDGAAPGTVRRLTPQYAKDYPRTLTAHDIGLKDLLDAFYLLGDRPQVVLFAVSIPPPREMHIGISPEVERAVPRIVRMVLEEAATGVGGVSA